MRLRICVGVSSGNIWVCERSPKKQRLHFHGLFNVPENGMIGELVEKRDYSFNLHQMRTTYQNTFFNDRFGRSDFERIDNKGRLGEALAYLMKYIEKTGEKIVYSKGLPQYFTTDVNESDVATRMGMRTVNYCYSTTLFATRANSSLEW